MWTIIHSIGSLILVVLACLLLRNLFYKYKRPNGKKGGIISFHAALASAIVTLTVLYDPFPGYLLIFFNLFLAYLIIRNKYENKEHYFYQIVFGIIIGISIPLGINYIYDTKIKHFTFSGGEREYAPEGIQDDRLEADEMPELKLDNEFD